jgi:iturin family lipopeptide synthetase A
MDYNQHFISNKKMEKYTGLEIAVIGLAGKFPGADNIEQYWQNLKDGKDCISTFSAEDAIQEGELNSIVKDPGYVKANAYLKNKHHFDAAFFNYRPDEAELMDPQARIFHECCWEALEDSGYTTQVENRIGVFAAGTPNVAWVLHAEIKNRQALVDPFTASQLRDVSFLCSRVSYKFNFKGPAIYIQTACSSSLVAIHQACNSLLLGECVMALAGGVNIQNYSKKGYIYKEGMIRSKDGKCKPFDKTSTGTVNGEGAGIVVLKRLKDAMRDRDHIYAIVKGTAINNDGDSKVGYTAPSVNGQAEVINKAHKMAKVEPSSISYVETHGTATELGDVIEMEALNKAFGELKEKNCVIGAVKSAIGHLDSAAGVAGFIKTVLAINNKQLPPSFYFDEPNPKINFNNGSFCISKELQNWKNPDGPLRAGVSSFGIGGTNAHAVLEEAPIITASANERSYQLLVLSAKTESSLEKNTERLLHFFRENDQVNLADVAYTLQKGRVCFKFRKMLLCQDAKEAMEILSEKKAAKKVVATVQEDLQQFVLLFSGQGSQYTNMCKDLYESEIVFKETLDNCLKIASQFSTEDFHSILFPNEITTGDELIHDTKYAQPLLFMIEYSLTRLLMHWGIQPNFMMGHSIGEYVAACISNVFTLPDALLVVIRRGELMSRAKKGCMLSVNITEAQLNSFIAKTDKIDLAVINSATSLVVAGTDEDIAAFEKQLTAREYTWKRVHTSHAFHSYMMNEMLTEFEKEVSMVSISEPQIPYISNVTGDFVTYEQISKPSYWSQHLRNTVQFLKGTERLLNKGNSVFIEVGPGRALCNYISDNGFVEEGRHAIVNTVRQIKQQVNDQGYLLEKLGHLWLNGAKMNWNNFYAAEQRTRVSLPTYAFDHQAFTADFNLNQLLTGQLHQHPVSAPEEKNGFIHVSEWKRTLLPNAATELMENKFSFLVFCGDENFSTLLINDLIASKQQVISIKPGSSFRQLQADQYEINLSEAGDLEKLWESFERSAVSIQHILYCVPLSSEFNMVTYDNREKRLADNYLGVSYIAKSLANSSRADHVDFTVIGNHLANVTEQDEIDPLKATIYGPTKIIPSEINHVRCKVIDITYPLQNDWQQLDQVIKIKNELFYATDEPLVAYRHNERWVQSYDALIHNSKTTSEIRIVDKGTYMIVGGFGGIGFSIATDLANKHQANLILVHRSEFPARDHWDRWVSVHGETNETSKRILQVLELERRGCKIDCYQVDVAMEAQVKTFMQLVAEHYPRVNGVIWAAGEVDYGGIILNRKTDDFIKYSSSKVNGLLLFEKYFQFKKLDFLALFSSVGNVIYQVKFGQVAYNTANEFLENYAHYARKKLGIHAFTINWCDWFDTGLTVNAVKKEEQTNDIHLINSKIDHAIYPKEGIDVFYKCLQHKAPVYNIRKGNLTEAIASHRARLREVKNVSRTSPLEIREALKKGNGLEKIITEIYSTFFGKEVKTGDNFFELGGDSLKAMSLVGRINQQTGTQLSIGDIYKMPTIQQLIAGIEDRKTGKEHKTIPIAITKESYIVSSEQRRMFFLQSLDEQSTLYNETELVWMLGKLDKKKVVDAFTQIIQRHESLRTSFRMQDNELKQFLTDRFNFEVHYKPYNENKQEELIHSLIHPFDLSAEEPLLRVTILEKNPNEHLMIMDSHHIVMDGVSRFVLREEFNKLYNKETLPLLKLQYKDYSEWQQSAVQQEIIAQQKKFWLNEFAGEIVTLELPTDFSRPLMQRHEGNSIQFEISTAETKKIKTIAAASGTTVYTVLLAALNILLAKLSNQEDIIIGTPVAGRLHADLEHLIGMFVNTIALRNYPTGDKQFNAFLSEVKSRSIACFDNQSLPFEELINELKPERDPSRNPLFDVMFVYQNYEDLKEHAQDLVLKPEILRHTESRFDITLLAVEDKGKLFLRLVYATKLFKESTIKKMTRYYKKIITSFTTNEQVRISDINLLSEKEVQQLLIGFNDTRVDYKKKQTILDLFSAIVKKQPQATALIYEDEKISYEELNNKANAIAQKIIKQLPDPHQKIALLFNPSVEMIASILAVMKTGNAYVPLSTEAPDERNEYILNDSDAKLLLVQEAAYKKSIGDQWMRKERILVVSETDPPFNNFAEPQRKVLPDDLVYAIYTSGTTGTPKGVELRHKGLFNYVSWNISSNKLTSADTGLQLVGYQFDGSGATMYSTLLSGGTLALIPIEQKINASYIARVIENKRVTNFAVVPGLYGTLIDELERNKTTLDLRFVILGGEKANQEIIKKSRSVFPAIRLENEYGPTETTITATHTQLMTADTSVIGKPIWNTSVYILGKNKELLPIGVKGELCISGAGLAKGYINNDALTAEKFVANPFKPLEKMYKTGDIARWLPDGRIEISGRADMQVKIRGYRIELGEIENQVSKYEGIKQAVVLANGKDDAKYLMVYYIAETEFEPEKLQLFLSGKLPDYMIPAHYMRIDQFPYTLNGKLDRSALPKHEIRSTSKYIEAETKEEKLLVEVWSRVLNIKNISVEDNFFSLGGDSIKSIQISSRMRNEGYEATVKNIFSCKNIKELALTLRATTSFSDQAEIKGEVALTPIQTWFFQRNKINTNHFNQSVLLNFKNGISKETVEKIFKKIQSHHDALRLVFTQEKNSILQRFKEIPAFPVAIEEHDIRKQTDAEAILFNLSNAIQESIDLKNGPLLKLGLFHMQDGSRLLIVIHHLVIDGVSWRILFEDIEQLYQQASKQEPLVLPLKTDSYQAWSKQLIAYTKSRAFQDAELYWKEALQKECSPLQRDWPEGENCFKNKQIESFQLSIEETSALLTATHRSFNAEINDILLTALLLSIEKMYGHAAVQIDVESHGREEFHEGINVGRTIGWFTSFFPVVLDKVPGDLATLIRHVKQILKSVPNNGIDYLLQRYLNATESTGEVRSSGISFNYLGQFDADTDGNSFQIANELTGDEVSKNKHRDYDWDISGIVRGGRLQMNLMFSRQQYKKETITSFMIFYKEQLTALIDYCSTYESTELGPSDLSYKELSVAQLLELQQQYSVQDVYPMSPMQEGMLFHALVDSGKYNGQLTFQIHAELDMASVEKTMNDLMARYDVLRTVFLHEGYECPLQLLLKERTIDFEYRDIRQECFSGVVEEIMQEFRLTENEKVFDLSKDVLMRLRVFKTAEKQYEFIWSYHHILMDGWCTSIILKDFKELYAANIQSKEITLPPVTTYLRYINWLEKRNKKESETYWENYLKNYEQVSSLPKREFSTAKINAENEIVQMLIDEEHTHLLKLFSRRLRVTLNTLLQAAWAMLLGKYNNTSDVVFGAVVSGRPPELAGVEMMVGLFINTIPVRIRFNSEDTIDAILTQIQQNALDTEQHHYHPLFEIQALSKLGRNLLDHILIIENYPMLEEHQPAANNVFPVSNPRMFVQSNYDLTIEITPGEQIQVKAEYNPNRYEKEVIEHALKHFNHIIHHIVHSEVEAVS